MIYVKDKMEKKICKECKRRKATAIINNKDVCQKCFSELKLRKSSFDKNGWLDKNVGNNNQKFL